KEFLALERAQECSEALPLDPVHGGHSALPEDVPEDCGVLQQALLGRGEGVQPGSDDPLHRLGRRELLSVWALLPHSSVLLRIERVPACLSNQRLLSVTRE